MRATHWSCAACNDIASLESGRHDASRLAASARRATQSRWEERLCHRFEAGAVIELFSQLPRLVTSKGEMMDPFESFEEGVEGGTVTGVKSERQYLIAI